MATGALLVAGGLVVIQLREGGAPQQPSAAASSVPAVPVPEFAPPPTTTPPPTPTPDVDPVPDVTPPPEDDEVEAAPVRSRGAMSADRQAPAEDAAEPEHDEDTRDDDDDDDDGDGDGDEETREDDDDRGDAVVLALRGDVADAVADRRDRSSLPRRAAERMRDRVDRACDLLGLRC